MKQVLVITSVPPSFRRVGIRFTRLATELDVSELSADKVKALKAEKNLVVHEKQAQAAAPTQSADSAQSNNNSDDVSIMDQLVEAIGKLDADNAEHFTTKGAPQLDALAEIVGQKVTAAQRDEAFALFSEQPLQPLQPSEK